MIQDEAKGTYELTTRKLHLKYFSSEKDYKGQVIFSDDRATIKTDNRKIIQGQNFFDYDLGNRFKTNVLYTAAVLDTQGKRHFITFRIK
jgi:hypothetical protein